MDTNLLSVQEEILDKQDRLMVVDAVILAPRIGGYNSRPYSITLQRLEPPRSSELKALWRWWMRVALSTAYKGTRKYNEIEKAVDELLGSTDKQSCFSVILKSTGKEWSKVHVKVNLIRQLLGPDGIIIDIARKVFDKGLKAGLTVEARLSPPINIRFEAREGKMQEFQSKLVELRSQLDITIRPTNKGLARASIKSSKDLEKLAKRLGLNISKDLLRMYDVIVDISRIPRVKLILQPRSEVREEDRFKGKIDENNKRYLQRIIEDLAPFIGIGRLPIKAMIFLNREINEAQLRFAISTLFLALILGGLGSITRRGFGSIIVRNLKITTRNAKYSSILNDEVNLFKKLLNASECKDLKENLIKLIDHVINLAKSVVTASSVEPLSIPEIPTLMYPNYFKFEVFKCRKDVNIIDLLRIIGEATLKSTWKSICGWSIREPGGSLHTWILGLPRKVKHKKAKYTGYFKRGDEEIRRISAISLKVFENRASEKFIIVYGFLSRDWPSEELVHKGDNYPKGKLVKELGIADLSHSRCTTINTEDMTKVEFLKKVFNSAFKFVTMYLKRKLGESVEYEKQ